MRNRKREKAKTEREAAAYPRWWHKRATQGELMTRREFYKWYHSTDWILSDTKPIQGDSGIMEVSVGRFADME